MYYSTNRLKGEESICNKAVNFPERTLRRAGAAMSVRQRRPLPHMTAPRPVWFRVLPHPLYKCPFFVIIVPSDDRANTPVSASFRRFLPFSPWLAPASLQGNIARQHRREYADSAHLRLKKQKPLEYPSLAGAGSFAGAEMCPDKERPAENTAVLSRGLTPYGRISARQNRVCPCQSMVFTA